jgi:argininosuccinate lyase
VNHPWLAFIESNTSGTGRLFVRAAVEQGSRPILLTDDPARYSYVEEEGLEVLRVDTQDEHGLLEACRRLAAGRQLAGVTSCSEYFIATAAALARRLKLPGPSPRAIRACRDKQTQRVRLQAAGIAVPQFRSARSVKTAVGASQQLGFPVVVKPVSGTGSIGVKLCHHADDVAAHADALLRERRNERGLPMPHRILIEEPVVGPEYSVETFCGEIVGITNKHVGPLPYFVEVGHDFPAGLSPEARESVCLTVSRALKAIGLEWGPAHLELRLTPAGPMMIEINPRLAGGFIPQLVFLATGVDLISETIRLVMGRQPRWHRTRDRHAAIRFLLTPHEGTLLKVQGLDEAVQIPGVADVRLYVRAGDRLRLRGDFRDRVGHVIAVGDTPAGARAAVEQAQTVVRLIVSPKSDNGGNRPCAYARHDR